MPRRDGTGPLGRGAKTGKKMGDCDSKTTDRLRPSSVKDQPLNNPRYGLGRMNRNHGR